MKTNSTNSMKIPRIIARVMSAIIVAFALIMFIGQTMESAKEGTSSPMTFYTVLLIALFAIGLLGLALAWKWELIGGIISLLAFIALFIGIYIFNSIALDKLALLFIYPANAILFIFVGYRSKALNQTT
ncbi:MAG: hypothetical protein Q8K02_16555 [Flavobacterium sp.]|nr:hypothetical protein [Flavobacterium sp.]